MTKLKYLYRYEDSDILIMPEFVGLQLRILHIVKETPKGYWILLYGTPSGLCSDKRWVPKEGKNIFAWDSEEKAIRNYIIRKRFQINLFKKRLEIAEGRERQAVLQQKAINNYKKGKNNE